MVFLERSSGRLALPLLLAGAILCSPTAAGAVDLALKLEPGVAFPLAAPQSNRFGVGGGGALHFALTVLPFLDLQVGGVVLGFTNKAGGDTPLVIGGGGGPRLQVPHRGHSISPWIDGEAYYVRTGGLDRFGFSAGAGIAFAVGATRSVWLGLHARYVHVVQPQKAGFDNTDAKLLLVGLSLEMGTPRVANDQDGDGIVDTEDRCPTIPGPRENAGCPWPDSDGDGVFDRDDKCPNVRGPQANHGCPWPDTDGDGVNDSEDRCPTVPGPKENGGCPWTDTDGDGVPDRDDKCPTAAGPRDNQGCPRDRDGDTVPDPVDACPDVAGPVDNGGCPRYKQVTVTKEKLELSEKIFFAYDKTVILPKSDTLLGEVVQALKDHPALKVRVEGHTDARGSTSHNQKLSDGRARAVYDYLVSHGVAAERLESKGYGPTLPLDSNKTPEGRERNRRVEFVITAQ